MIIGVVFFNNSKEGAFYGMLKIGHFESIFKDDRVLIPVSHRVE